VIEEKEDEPGEDTWLDAGFEDRICLNAKEFALAARNDT